MRRVASLAIAVIFVVSAALGCPSAEQGFTRLASADAEIAYRWDPADLRIGRFFAAEVVACRTPGDQPIRGHCN
jgi:hypothetical protein